MTRLRRQPSRQPRRPPRPELRRRDDPVPHGTPRRACPPPGGDPPPLQVVRDRRRPRRVPHRKMFWSSLISTTGTSGGSTWTRQGSSPSMVWNCQSAIGGRRLPGAAVGPSGPWRTHCGQICGNGAMRVLNTERRATRKPVISRAFRYAPDGTRTRDLRFRGWPVETARRVYRWGSAEVGGFPHPAPHRLGSGGAHRTRRPPRRAGRPRVGVRTPGR